MMPGAVDHALAFGLAVLFPAYAAASWFPRLRAAAGAGLTSARVHSYREVVGAEWSLAALTAAVWLLYHRAFEDLGFGWTWGAGPRIAIVATALLIVVLTVQRIAVLRNPAAQRRALEQQQTVEPVLPRTADELRWFRAVALTAGVCEELMYRGFLLWYFDAWFPIGVAAAATTVLFGLAHAYQGPRGILLTGLVGTLFVALRLLTGSLWVPALLHAFWDWNSGSLAYRLLTDRAPESEDAGETVAPPKA
jgi:membrane protease YdiL (CAAX protease family)